MKRSASLNQTPRPVYSFDIELAFRSLLTISFCFLFDPARRSPRNAATLQICRRTEASLGTISMILVRNKPFRRKSASRKARAALQIEKLLEHRDSDKSSVNRQAQRNASGAGLLFFFSPRAFRFLKALGVGACDVNMPEKYFLFAADEHLQLRVLGQ